MEILKDRYTITELSERLGITDHALRYYEKEFNMNIPKDSRGRRYYTPEYANVMFQIKTMRDDGLEIKAIKKILECESVINEPPPVVSENGFTSMTPVESSENIIDIKNFFNEFGERLTLSFSNEVADARDQINRELTKTKLELGACMENNIRKIESKLDKHFENVDRSLGLWRERNKGGFFSRLSRVLSKKKTI
ncbi:MerR family transcriptional regulator [Acetivibrio cellulolyticus]|uniref:MerR family transcriptional regulator n=1 Tax=Acetivibrio cellulolyticus TaxID=35830 RepID=UPI0001E2D47C|nr:MerR family transcriptional regulator [Acetivibrio cellulolyticus]